jgi:predicted nucleic acid-binding protein
MILADTSAWIEFDRATGSRAHLRMRELVSEIGPLAVTEPVVMEVVAGAANPEREVELRRLLARFTLLGFDAAVDFDGAAWIYRRCRVRGVTPRGMVDCMIAAVARRRRATLLAHDADLVRIAAVIGVQLDPASTILA